MPEFQSGAGADFLVGKVFVEFQPHQFAAAFVQCLKAEPHQPDTLPAGDLFVGQWLRIGGVDGGLGVGAGHRLERHNFPALPPLVQSEVMHRAIEPGLRLMYRVELCM